MQNFSKKAQSSRSVIEVTKNIIPPQDEEEKQADSISIASFSSKKRAPPRRKVKPTNFANLEGSNM
jgi:hypothetical protein